MFCKNKKTFYIQITTLISYAVLLFSVFIKYDLVYLELEAIEKSKTSKVHPLGGYRKQTKGTHTTTNNIDYSVTKLTKDLQSDRIEVNEEDKNIENDENSIAYPTFENMGRYIF